MTMRGEAHGKQERAFLAGGGECADLIASYDWSRTGLGPIEAWPQSLRTATALLLRSPVPIVLLWGEPGYMIYNDAYSLFAGGRHPTLLGSEVRQGWPEVAEFNDNVMRVGLAGRTLAYKDQELTLHRHGRPEQVWMNLDYSPVLDEEGEPAGVICILGETTQRVAADRRLAMERERQRLMLRQMPGFAALLYGPDHRFDYVNDAYVEIAGRSEIVGRTVRGVFPELAGQGFYELLDRVYATGERYAARAIPIRLDRMEGERVIDLLYEPVRDDSGRVIGIFVGGYDGTEQARAEAARRASETRYRTLFEAIESGFCLVEVDLDRADGRIDYRVVEANPAFFLQTGFPEAILGAWLREAAPTLEDHWYETYGAVARTGEPTRFEQGSDMLGRWFDVSAFRVGEAQERRVAILFNDISARRAAEEGLRELNATLEGRVAHALAERRLLASIVEGTDAFVQVVDLDYRWLAINRAAADEFAHIFGIRPKIGDSMVDLLADQPEHQDAVRAVWSRALAGEEFTEIAEFGDPARDRRFYEMRYNSLFGAAGERIGAYQFVYDVTARVKEQTRLAEAEEALRQSQKMEAIGQLTGGVAHDFNNLLTPIVGALDLLQRKGVGGEREQRLIAGAAQSAERAKTLVQRLLAFARRQPLQPVPVDLGRLVANMAELVASTTGPQIRITIDVDPRLPPAIADPNQVEMAVLNLAVNARDAMPDGGTLRIAAAAETVRSRRHVDLRPGEYVRLSVSDTGTGMDEPTLRRAIEPFFSTKGVGKGTGLGLSMVHGLASQLGGALAIDSRAGAGTDVVLWLPVSAEPALEGEGVVETAPRTAQIGTALLVDDETLVRASTADMLADLGYAVVEAGSAEEALDLVRGGLTPTLLVTDHLMPGMRGADLARKLGIERPGLKVLVVSGYAENEGIDPDLPRLTKPFRTAELAIALDAAEGAVQ